MNCERVRALARALPGVGEKDHFGRPSFRVHNKIFATLWEPQGRAMVKLSLADQMVLVLRDPAVFLPVPGRWGEQGATFINLALASEAVVQGALQAAWNGVASAARKSGTDSPVGATVRRRRRKAS